MTKPLPPLPDPTLSSSQNYFYALSLKIVKVDNFEANKRGIKK